MKSARKFIVALIAVLLSMAVAVCAFTACGEKTPEITGTAIEGWSDDWGADDWGDGYEPPSSDPGDYNKIDWSGKYGSAEGGLNAMRGTSFIPFYPGNGAHIYQAENAVLAGGANTTEGGTYVGYLDNSAVTFNITSEAECDALVVISTAVNPAFTSGLPFNQQYSMCCNDERIDTSDCWLVGTGGWATFKDNIVGEVHLVAGSNTIEFASGIARTNIDYIKLVPTTADTEKYPPDPSKYLPSFDLNQRIEAESTYFTNARTESSTNNTGVNISWTSDDTELRFTVINTLPVSVTRTLAMYAAFGAGDDDIGTLSPEKSERITLTVGGEQVTLSGELPLIDGIWYNTYVKQDIAQVTLPADSTTEFVIKLTDQINIDYFELYGDPVPVSIKVTDYKATYAVGESVDKADLTVVAVNDHGADTVLTAEDFTVTHDPFDAVSDAETVTVTFTDGSRQLTAQYTVRVLESTEGELTGMKIAAQVNESGYKEGSAFAPTSVTVTGIYGNGSEQPMDSGEYTLQYSLSAGGEWQDSITLPEVDATQGPSSTVTVYVRATYKLFDTISATTELSVTVYDSWQYTVKTEYAAYDGAYINGTAAGRFGPFWAGNGVHRYEAENAVLGGIATNDGDHVGNLRNDAEKGDATVTYTIESPAEENVQVLLVMSMAINPSFTNKAYFPFTDLAGNKVSVSDADGEMTEYPMNGYVKDTNDWNTYADSAVGVITLEPGVNTIVLTFAADATNLDYIKLVPMLSDMEKYPADQTKYLPEFAADQRIEAESTYFTDARTESSTSNTGTNLCWTNSNTVVEFVIDNTSGEEMTRTLSMFAAAGTGDDTTGPLSSEKANRLTLTVGGEQVTLSGELNVTASDSWWSSYSTMEIADITIPAGQKVIVRLTLSDQLNIDYFELTNKA